MGRKRLCGSYFGTGVSFTFLLILHVSLSYFNPPLQQHQIFPAPLNAFPSQSRGLGGLNNNNLNSNLGNANSHSAAVPSSSGSGETEFFDLSYTFNNDTIVYPGQRFNRFHLLMDVGPTTNRTPSNYIYSYASWSVCFSEHGGTHIDAPYHFNRYGWRVAEIPLNRLVDLPTAVIDVEHHVFALKNPDEFVLQVGHLLEHESKFGQIPHGALIFVRFGWGRFYPDWIRYTGFNNATAGSGGAPFTFSYPAVSGNAASWLLRERGLVGIGTDTLSPDRSTTNPVVHILLLENQVYLLENVANLDYLMLRTRREREQSSCDLRTFVLPIKSMGTGGPVRLVSYCKN